MLKLTAITAFAVSVMSFVASAATYELNDALSSSETYLDWTSTSSYKGNPASLPGAGDIVEIPKNMTVKMLAGSDSWELMNTLARVAPRSGSTFIIEVPADETAELNIPVTEYGMEGSNDKATLVKRGGGILQFCSYAKVKDGSVVCDYYLNLDVQEGKLRLYAGGTNTDETFNYRSANIGENGTLEICKVGRTRLIKLTGSGLVTLNNTAEQRIYLVGTGHYVFDGLITGPIRFDITKGRHDFTCKENRNNTICLSGDAICGFTSIGSGVNAYSTVGTGNFNLGGSSGIIYIGNTGDISDKPIWGGAKCFIDGGEYGGLKLNGKIDFSGSSMRVLRLIGDHANPCEFWGAMPIGYPSSTNIVTVNKSGTGIWCLMGNKGREGMGVIAVENGTLQYDSIAEKGYPCSLGYSTNLYEALTTGKLEDAADKTVDYSFLLGGDGTTGTMEYIGNKYGWCTSRLMAVKSSGRFVSDVSPYWLEDVYAFGTGNKTFTLSGSSDHGNTATLFSDGNDGGKLNVVKDGSGTWTLTKPTSFTGELLVTGGVLKVENNSNYRWYRMNFTENGYGCPRYDTTLSLGTNANGTAVAQGDAEKVSIQLLEFAMYDAEGNNILLNLQTGESPNAGEAGVIAQYDFDDNYRTQKVGTVAFASKKGYYTNYKNGKLLYLFDGKSGTKTHAYIGADSDGITQDDPSSWMSLVMRLPDNAPEAVRLDFMSSMPCTNGIATYNGRILTAYRLDGSVDGVNWDIGIAGSEALDAPKLGARWYSDHTDSVSKTPRPNKGFEIKKTKSDSVPSHSFSTIGVANGGVLEVIGDPIEVSGLVVDASAPAGTISNFKFAASGTVDVRNADLASTDSLELPGDYSDLDGFSNLGKWNLTFDGERHASLVLSAANGKLTVRKRGLRVIFR